MDDLGKRWSCEKAWAWYDARPWLRGCNYLPADCCNRVSMWQSFEFEKHLGTMDREFALAASIGFNTIRVIFEFEIWHLEKESFPGRFERVVQLAAKHGLSLAVCLANDCTIPKKVWKPVQLGPQHYDWGYHGGRKSFPDSGRWPEPGYYPAFDDPGLIDEYFEMVTYFVTKYASDPRIAVWDLYNEPGMANRGDVSVPNAKHLFEVARGCHPSQPLTADIWSNLDRLTAVEKTVLELSDIISYHTYSPYEDVVMALDRLRKLGRPIIVTEWLHRPQHNTVHEIFPLFFLNKIGCWNWGLVAGLSQTYELWNGIWDAQEAGRPWANIDYTKWQHDLFHPNYRPYDPQEIETIRRFCQQADKDFKENNRS